MSLPNQSVPNICSKEGGWFIIVQLVVMLFGSMKKLITTTKIKMKADKPIASNVLVLKFMLPKTSNLFILLTDSSIFFTFSDSWIYKVVKDICD